MSEIEPQMPESPITNKEIGYYIAHMALNSFPSVIAEGLLSLAIAGVVGDRINDLHTMSFVTLSGAIGAGGAVFGTIRAVGHFVAKKSQRLSIHNRI